MSNIYDRVLITGGGGMLAKALVRALRARGSDPVAAPSAVLDVTEPAQIRAILDKHRPLLILNCAAHTKVDLCEADQAAAMAINSSGAGLMAHAAASIGSKLVHYSTDFVFNGASRTPYLPTDHTDPQSVYGTSKFIGETLIQRDPSRDYLIIRTAWLYGPGGSNFVQTMLNAARAGKKLSVVDDQIGSPTFTHDLAEITLDLIDHNARGIYHATNSGQTSWFEFAKAVFEEFNLPADLSPTTSTAWKESHPNSATRPAYSVLDCSATEKLIGRPLPHWRDALHRYHDAIDHAGS